jgi:hypothetical protein
MYFLFIETHLGFEPQRASTISHFQGTPIPKLDAALPNLDTAAEMANEGNSHGNSCNSRGCQERAGSFLKTEAATGGAGTSDVAVVAASLFELTARAAKTQAGIANRNAALRHGPRTFPAQLPAPSCGAISPPSRGPR